MHINPYNTSRYNTLYIYNTTYLTIYQYHISIRHFRNYKYKLIPLQNLVVIANW